MTHWLQDRLKEADGDAAPNGASASNVVSTNGVQLVEVVPTPQTVATKTPNLPSPEGCSSPYASQMRWLDGHEAAEGATDAGR